MTDWAVIQYYVKFSRSNEICIFYYKKGFVYFQTKHRVSAEYHRQYLQSMIKRSNSLKRFSVRKFHKVCEPDAMF